MSTSKRDRNLVAKHARKFNKAVRMRDRKNDYTRKVKHKRGKDDVDSRDS